MPLHVTTIPATGPTPEMTADGFFLLTLPAPLIARYWEAAASVNVGCPELIEYVLESALAAGVVEHALAAYAARPDAEANHAD